MPTAFHSTEQATESVHTPGCTLWQGSQCCPLCPGPSISPLQLFFVLLCSPLYTLFDLLGINPTYPTRKSLLKLVGDLHNSLCCFPSTPLGTEFCSLCSSSRGLSDRKLSCGCLLHLGEKETWDLLCVLGRKGEI